MVWFCVSVDGTAKEYRIYERKFGFVSYDGFQIIKESLTKSKKQLVAIAAMTPIQKQFVGTW
jgi:hypothetical protein